MMARLVRHEEMGPYEIPEGTELPVWICGCGLSKNKPFCDGSHKTTEFKPMIFKVEEKKTAYLCQCKHTKTPPFCDGTHKTLP